MNADLLSTARAALEENRPGDALTPLIAVWRSVRAPRLAQFIDWVSARVESVPVKEQHQWLELARARDALALPGLLATLTDTNFDKAQDRAHALLDWIDPRIGTAALKLFSAPRYQTTGAQWFYERLFKALAVLRDPRLPPGLEAIAARMPQIVRNSYGPTLAAKLVEEANAMTVDSGDEGELRAALDALEPFFASERGDSERAESRKRELATQEAALRSRAMANPDDDGAFLVWADVLTEQGDPRGELMSLQLLEKKAGLGAEQLVKLRALQSQHRDRLLGALAPVVVNALFERGVAVHVELGRQWNHPATPEAEWASVRGVTLPDRHHNDWPAFLATLPKLTSVLRIRADEAEQLGRLRGGRQLEHLLLFEPWNIPESLEANARHLSARQFEFAPILCAHAGASVTLEASRSPEETVRALESARARVVRFVDGVHLLEPAGWYGWCLEFDSLERSLTVRGRFSGAPDFAKLDAWLEACERLKPSTTRLDDSPQRDASYLPLQRFTYPQKA
ncbi:MAG: TIGR02996 domain-containing protein [Archangium sp.]|nr:TIGR02996 domain-containing protein [Archangium sp.]